jgi:hypothetical protein
MSELKLAARRAELGRAVVGRSHELDLILAAGVAGVGGSARHLEEHHPARR